LIDTVAAHPTPLALLLDRFAVLRSPVVLGLVQELIDRLPRGAQLIIGLRGVPELGQAGPVARAGPAARARTDAAAFFQSRGGRFSAPTAWPRLAIGGNLSPAPQHRRLGVAPWLVSVTRLERLEQRANDDVEVRAHAPAQHRRQARCTQPDQNRVVKQWMWQKWPWTFSGRLQLHAC